MAERVSGSMNTIAGLPVAIESHGDARAGGGRAIRCRACSQTFPPAPRFLPLPLTLFNLCLNGPIPSFRPWVPPLSSGPAQTSPPNPLVSLTTPPSDPASSPSLLNSHRPSALFCSPADQRGDDDAPGGAATVGFQVFICLPPPAAQPEGIEEQEKKVEGQAGQGSGSQQQ